MEEEKNEIACRGARIVAEAESEERCVSYQTRQERFFQVVLVLIEVKNKLRSHEAMVKQRFLIQISINNPLWYKNQRSTVLRFL